MKRALARHSAAAQTDRLSRAPKPARLAVLGLLLALSFALMTVYFREGDAGQLHRTQRHVGSTFAPVEGVIQRVAQPFRDVAGWADAVSNARSERDRLRAENQQLRQQLSDRSLDARGAAELEQALGYLRSASYARLSDYAPRAANVLVRSPGLYRAKVLIDQGTASGVRVDDPVLSGAGSAGAALVGRITAVTSDTAELTLISDPQMAVTATDPFHAGADGSLTPSSGDSSSLKFDYVEKTYPVHQGDPIVTSGTVDAKSNLPSRYPAGIPIGVVQLVAQYDTESFKTIQVAPWVDLRAFRTVIVLTRARR